MLSDKFAPHGEQDKFYFDVCEAVVIEDIMFNVWSMSIPRQLELMESADFESGIDAKDPVFQMT